MNPSAERKYWFPAKRYGWGWGLPITWQGWLVDTVWAAALVVGSTQLIRRPAVFVLYSLGLAAVLLAIHFAKGEPPRWRWGDDKDH